MSDVHTSKQSFGAADLRWLLPGLILLSGLLCSGLLAWNTAQQNKQRVEQQLTAQVDEISHEVQHYVSMYQYGLRGLRGAYLSAGSAGLFNYQTMQVYTESRDYSTEFPGARGFGFIQLVTPEQLPEFLATAAAERPDGIFKLRQLNPHQDDLFLIRYIEPESNNKQAIGLDIGSEINRRQAALAAAEKNQMVITAPITLVQAENKVAQGFLILLPIYKTRVVPELAEQRLQQLAGWAYAPLLIEEVLSALDYKAKYLIMRLSDSSVPGQQAFFNRGDRANLAQDFNSVSRAIAIGGRQWVLSLAPTRTYIQELALQSPLRDFIGWMIVSCFLALIAYTVQLVIARRLAASRYQVDLALAEERSLKEANAQLEVKVHARTLELAKLGALNRSILSASPYALIATDPNGIITVFNPSAEQLLGYAADELVGVKSPALFHSPEEIERRAQQLTAEFGVTVVAGFEVFVFKARRGEVEQQNWTYLQKDGSRITVSLSVTALHNDAGNLEGFLGVAQNLEPQLRRERELEDAKEKAQQASKTKTEFLANVSHEIRTPMNGILGLLRIVLNSELPDRQRDFLQKAHQSALSLLALLNDILDLSKIEAGKLDIEFRPLSFTEFLDDLANLLAPQAEQKNIELIFDLAPDLPELIVTDGNRLRQILINLVGNAIKFTHSGNVVVSVAVRSGQSDQVILHIIVKDDGIGMTNEQLQGLFQEFQQADSSISRRFGGTGLGLAIVRKLLHLLGGDIQVSSVFGAGSQFSFSIPISLELPQPHQPLGDFTGTRVLIVEDNATSRLVLQALLIQLGCEVLCAGDMLQATTMLVQQQQAHQPVRLVITDWMLPDGNGIILLEAIAKHADVTDKPIPILMTSHRTKLMDNQLQQHTELPFSVLLKPISRIRLRDMLNRVLHSETVEEQPAEHNTSLAAGDAQSLKGMQILLVEDNPTNRIVATELLSQAGATVTEAHDGYQALKQLKRRRFDVILMDLQMPGIDGIETTRMIRTELGIVDIPIVAMTANATKDDKMACKVAGMSEHIGKPFEIEKVIALLLALTTTKVRAPRQSALVKPQLPTELQKFAVINNIGIDNALTRLVSLELYGKVVQQFALDVAAAQHQLRQSQLKLEQARLLYHSLKSGAANCGFTALAVVLQQAETTSRQALYVHEIPNDAVLQALAQALPVLTALQPLVQSAIDRASVIKETASPERIALSAALEQFRQLLIHSDMQAIEQFQQLKGPLQQIDAAMAAQIETQLNALAFATCLELLQQIRFTEVVHEPEFME